MATRKANPHKATLDALTACKSAEDMARVLGVSGKTSLRPFLRAKIGRQRDVGFDAYKTPASLALIVERFVK